MDTVTTNAAPVTVNPIGTRPDSQSTITVRYTSYSLSILDGERTLATLRDTDGKVRKNADGSPVTDGSRVSVSSMHKAMYSVLLKLPGADTLYNGSRDYSSGSLVDVAWKMNGEPMNLRMRKAFCNTHASKKAENASIIFAVKQMDGTYAEWPIRVGDIVSIAGNK